MAPNFELAFGRLWTVRTTATSLCPGPGWEKPLGTAGEVTLTTVTVPPIAANVDPTCPAPEPEHAAATTDITRRMGRARHGACFLGDVLARAPTGDDSRLTGAKPP